MSDNFNKDGNGRPRWSIIIRTVITISILGYLSFKINWIELKMELMRSDLSWLVVAFLFFGLAIFFASVRWWHLLRVHQIEIPLKTTTALTLIGQFFNAFLLGTTGSNVVRLVYIIQYAPNKKNQSTISIIMDCAVGLFILLCSALILASLQVTLMQQQQVKIVFFSLISLFVAILMIGFILASNPLRYLRISSLFHKIWVKIPYHDILESFIHGFREYGRAQGLTIKAMACGVAILFAIITASYCIALSLHINVTYPQIFTIITVVLCVISLPISIGGHGIREGSFHNYV